MPRVPTVAYFGLPLGALLLLADGVDIAFAVLSPIDAPGRRRLSRELTSRVLDAGDFEAPTELEAAVDVRFSAARPNLIVSWYFTRRLPVRWLEAAPLGAIGAHPSLLPRHRGPNPFFGAIDSGDAVTGVSVHRLVERYDEGAVLLTETVPIGDRNSWQLARALDRPSLRLLRAATGRLVRGEPIPELLQDEALATWAPEPTADLLRVDWTWPTERVLRRVRAVSPVPGVAIEIRGVDLFVTEAARAPAFPATLLPGEAAQTPDGIVVRTGDGAVLLRRATLAQPGSEDDDEPIQVDGRALAARVFGATDAEPVGFCL